jgi:hypothetical protein
MTNREAVEIAHDVVKSLRKGKQSSQAADAIQQVLDDFVGITSKVVRHCFCCEKPLLGAIDGELKQDFNEPPSDATVWTGNGNYGSTVMDDCFESKLYEISICDDCLKSRAKHVFSIEKRTITQFQGKWKP